LHDTSIQADGDGWDEGNGGVVEDFRNALLHVRRNLAPGLAVDKSPPEKWLSDFSSCDSIGDKLATVLAELGRWTLDIVRRPAAAEGFVILPRR
jgi:hypothetical protein